MKKLLFFNSQFSIHSNRYLGRNTIYNTHVYTFQRKQHIC